MIKICFWGKYNKISAEKKVLNDFWASKNGLEAFERKNFGFERRKMVWKHFRGKILLLEA
ncbi:MAG: hypothetical protein IJQ82_04430 [Selenomonadaceae bacterium]|nr:hypothetical protein [Selenomonadaceae bacterium]